MKANIYIAISTAFAVFNLSGTLYFLTRGPVVLEAANIFMFICCLSGILINVYFCGFVNGKKDKKEIADKGEGVKNNA